MIQDEAGLRAEPRGPRHAPLLRLAGWEPAASRLTNPTTCEMPKRFGAKRQNKGLRWVIGARIALCSARKFGDNNRVSTRSLNLTAMKAVSGSGSADRFFQWSLYILVVVGFAALMGTNKLDAPSLALVLPALLLRGYLLLMRKTLVISERWTTFLTLIYFAFYAADYFYFSESFISATVHMVLFSMVIKIFSVRRDRDLMYLAVLSFLMLLAAAVLTVDTLFLLTFSVFILVAIATFVSMEMRRSEQETLAAGVPPHHDAKFYGSLAGISGILGLLTLAGAALLFFILPRVSSSGYLRNLGVQSSLVAGFSPEVNLGGIGQIQQSSNVVMHIEVQFGKLSSNPHWRGITLANFDGRHWWNPLEIPTQHGLNNTPLDLTRISNFSLYSESRRYAPHLQTLTYRVVMEPVGLNLFFLAPVPLKINGDYRILEIKSDGSIFNVHAADNSSGTADEGGQTVGIYTAEADTRNPEPFVIDSNSTDYPAHIANLYLQVPTLDPRIAQLARQVTASSTSNYTRARDIERYLQSNYGYTLQLPGLREPDPLARFLFERKKGHCEYFATSMVMMLRTLGIPSRIVNGFRGGEYNDLTSSYIIREKDAHSWVEVYFPEYGWVSFDPTPAGNADEPQTGWSRVGLYLDAARQIWREWIVNYDFTHQMKLRSDLSTATGNAQSNFRTWAERQYFRVVELISRWQRKLQDLSPRQMALCCVLLGLLLAMPFAPMTWRTIQRTRALRHPQKAPRTSASFWYQRMLKMMARRGVRKEQSQTAEEFASSIPDARMRHDVELFTEHYERARFDASVEDAQLLPDLYEEIAGKK
jgi:protein-glutamine gamma-glutamyltransferase